jgi:hypothetical protein
LIYVKVVLIDMLKKITNPDKESILKFIYLEQLIQRKYQIIRYSYYLLVH